MAALAELLSELLSIDATTFFVIGIMCSMGVIALKMILGGTLLTIFYSLFLLISSIVTNKLSQIIGFTSPLGEDGAFVSSLDLSYTIFATLLGMSLAGCLIVLMYRKLSRFI